MEETLIKVDAVSKKFCRSLQTSLWYGLQDLTREITGRRHGGDGQLRAKEFWAVKNVSFEIKRGECLGLIGRNGAGKTTLLKMLNGLIKPDTGRIEIHGRVGALIALGAGFNPVLSGRENIYTNASVLGLTKKEIDSKVDEIIDFSEIAEFIDMPVQSYSSGMSVRLGFSIATSIQPEVLFLDEVLAVGDVRFQAKCYSRIAELKNKCAVVIVSHSMHSIARMSDRILLLERGQGVNFDLVQDGIVKYYEINRAISPNEDTQKEGTGDVEFEDVRVKVINDDLSLSKLTMEILIEIDMAATNDVKVFMDLVFRNVSGQAVAECPSSRTSPPIHIEAGSKTTIAFKLAPVSLASGSYLCSLYALDEKCLKHYCAWINFTEIHVTGDNRYTSPIQLFGSWKESVRSEE
jgi:lipopolysaccharide transport system ATP-binding protein